MMRWWDFDAWTIESLESIFSTSISLNIMIWSRDVSYWTCSFSFTNQGKQLYHLHPFHYVDMYTKKQLQHPKRSNPFSYQNDAGDEYLYDRLRALSDLRHRAFLSKWIHAYFLEAQCAWIPPIRGSTTFIWGESTNRDTFHDQNAHERYCDWQVHPIPFEGHPCKRYYKVASASGYHSSSYVFTT